MGGVDDSWVETKATSRIRRGKGSSSDTAGLLSSGMIWGFSLWDAW